MHLCQIITAGFIICSLSAEKNGTRPQACRFLLNPAINQLEDSQLAWRPPPLSRLLVPLVSINVDSCQSQRESIRKKKKKHPVESHNSPAEAQGSVNDWICWIGASGRGLLAPCLTQPPSRARPTPRCLLPCSFTVSLCCFYVIHFLQPCHRLLTHLSA